MARTLDTATAAALITQTLYLTWILRLDIVTEPVYVNSGIADLTFGVGYDAKLQGPTFLGMGHIGEISAITDSANGSQSVTISLPGVDLSLDFLKQLITNGDLWQRRNGYIWLATCDVNGAIVGKPFRVKTGRMDMLTVHIDPGADIGELSVTLESQQAYTQTALFSKYIEQAQLDASDTSQKYVLDLANKVPEIGNLNSNASGAGAGVNSLIARTIGGLIGGRPI